MSDQISGVTDENEILNVSARKIPAYLEVKYDILTHTPQEFVKKESVPSAYLLVHRLPVLYKRTHEAVPSYLQRLWLET